MPDRIYSIRGGRVIAVSLRGLTGACDSPFRSASAGAVRCWPLTPSSSSSSWGGMLYVSRIRITRQGKTCRSS